MCVGCTESCTGNFAFELEEQKETAIIPGSVSIKCIECKTCILCYGRIFKSFTTNILAEVAAEQKDVNERIKAKDNG